MPEKDISKHSFAVRTVENWNSLPDSIKAEVRAGNIQAETEARECLTKPICETTESKTNNKLTQVECLTSKTSTYIDI